MASLIVFRLVQGVAAGVIIPLMTTMLVRVSGRNRLGRMMTIAMMLIVVAPVFGPVAVGPIFTSRPGG
jgi:MFS family permease